MQKHMTCIQLFVELEKYITFKHCGTSYKFFFGMKFLKFMARKGDGAAKFSELDTADFRHFEYCP